MKNNSYQNYFFALLISALPFIANGQVNDAGIWAELQLEKRITRQFSVDLVQAFRWYENFTELGTVFTQAGASYRFANRLTLGAHYRFTQRKQVEEYYSMRHRYMIDLSYRLKFNKLSATFRERFQSTYKDIGRRDKGEIPENYFRSRLTLKYNLNQRYTPFVSGELFYQINEYMDKLRLKAGFDYEFSKYSTIDLYYMVNKEIQVKNPWTSYVIGIGYSYSF